MRIQIRSWLFWLVFVLCASFEATEPDPLSWIEDSFEDFADGALGAAGQERRGWAGSSLLAERQ
ncbi:MAG: hypothetical protein FJW26_07940 [Acidimicrobiia bacterium]|nr:hypothetical protein [Acidimicrobiia bacterium]